MSKLNSLGSLVLNLALVGGWTAIAAAAERQVKKGIMPGTDVKLQVGTVKDLPTASTSVKEWMVQIEAATVQVTGVKLVRIETGLEIVLKTLEGKALQVDATKFRIEGNSLIADIPNALLVLPEGQPFTADNPTNEIATVQVVQQDGSSIRLIVTGVNALPQQAVILKTGAFAYSLNPKGDETDVEIVVMGEGQPGYRVPTTSTVTGTNTPLQDIPQSIQIIPEELLRDQRADISDALLNAPSVRTSSPTNFDSLRIQVRGFFSTPTLNGFKDSLSSNLGPDLTGIDRIEVIGGPNSILFGATSPGGTVNFVTKRPLPDPYYFAEATVGNFNFYRGEVDLSGPINKSQNVLYRLNASYRDQGFFTDFSQTRSLVIAPVLSLALGENTKLTLEGIYKDLEFKQISFGLPLIGTIQSNPNGRIPRDRNVNEGTLDADGSRAGFTLEHQFSESWSLQSAFQFSRYFSSYSDPKGATFPTQLLPDGRTLERVYFTADYDQRDYRFKTDVISKFTTGSIRHQLLLGFDLGRQTANSNGVDREMAPLDLFNPIYGQLPGDILFEYDTNTVTDELGLIIQDQITIANNLILLVGGRFNTFSQTDRDLLADTKTSQSGNAFSPRAGIVYKPISPISLYANYSRSFQPAIGQAFDGSDFEPTRGTQFELGVKADLNPRLSTTLAVYQITQSNVLTEDTSNPGFSVQTGEQRSRGIEVSIIGEILPGWNIFASYAYNDARITEDNSIPVGNRVQRTTPNAASLWTTYEFQQGYLQGLGFGLGLFYVGDRAGDAANTFEVPSYFLTDAAVFFKRERFRVALNIKNLFNVNYFENAFGPLRVSPGAPFTVQGSISWTF